MVPNAPASYTPAHLTQHIFTLRSAIEGERKLVSVLFCDIADSTQMATKLGADATHVLLNRFFELALGEVHRFEGTINQFLGDGFMALFGAPLAYEDHARRALLTALAVRQRLLEAAVQEADLGQVRVRMGVNTGMVVVGKIGDNLRMDYTAVGDTTNLAARLQQSAQPDTILLSPATQRAASAFFHFRGLGRHVFKGIAEPLEVYELVKARAQHEVGGTAAPFGIGSPLVGREAEQSALMASLKSLHEGRGGIVLLIGEPGVGKSRMLAEVRNSSNAVGIRWLEGRSLSFGRNLSYWPFLEILRQCFRIDETDTEAQAWRKLECHCTELFGERAEEHIPYLGTVLSLEMSPERQQRVKHLDSIALGRQVFVSMRRLLERLADRQPLLVLMEDWHWVDHSSVGLCEHLLPLASGCAVAFWFATRPEPVEPIGRVRAAASKREEPAPVKEIVVAALAGEQSTLLLDNLVGVAHIPEELRARILRKTEGNPFFMEEVIRALIAEGVLIQDLHNGTRRLTSSVETLVLPDTVHAVILARIDRLEEGVKGVLTLASVIGRSFFLRILQAINQASENLARDLGQLEQAELIRVRRQLPELEYIFKHGLVQEAAYDSIVTERRRGIHRSVAKAIEVLFSERLDEFTSMLAYHYSRSEDWERAQQYLLRAGDLAGRMAADTEALEHYRQAIVARERAMGTEWPPLQRATLYRQMGEALFRIGQLPQALAFLNDALRHLGHPYPKSRRRLRMELARRLLRQLVPVLVPPLSKVQVNRRRTNAEVARELCRTVTANEQLQISTAAFAQQRHLRYPGPCGRV
ncbi:MAG: adenylate/guanylate cyclase domain-containing protein, partial [Comamonadaceae bacterium]